MRRGFLSSTSRAVALGGSARNSSAISRRQSTGWPRLLSCEGTKIVFLCRLAVVFPFTYLNYAFGLTAIPLWRYVVATFFGILPATVAFVFASSAATTAATTSTSSITKAVYIAGGVMAIIVSVLIGRIATKAIKRAGVED